MNSSSHRTLAIAGGVCGIVGTLSYFAAVFVDFGNQISYAQIMLWPILTIISLYALNRVVAATTPNHFNHLMLMFGALAFTLVATMISAQVAVRIGIEEYLGSASAADQETLKLIRKSVRMVDLGIDVAWDYFIGTTLILLMLAVKKHPWFGLTWGIPAGLFGFALIVLNTITFPHPPNTRGLFDIGPFIGLFIIALNVRLIVGGLKTKPGGVAPRTAEGEEEASVVL